MLQANPELINKAKDFFNKRDYKNSLTVLNEIIETEDKNSEAFFLMGNIFHMKGQIGKAIKAFNKVVEIDPKHTEAAISLSVLYNDIGKYEKAKTIFDKANDNVKKDTESFQDPHINKKFSLKHFELAEMYFSYNRYEEAIFEYDKAIGLDPGNLEIRIKVAKVYSKKGFKSKSMEVLRKLKSENPSYLPARIALGLLYFGNGNVLEAQSEWYNVLNMDPNNQEAKMYLDLSNKSATETKLN
jgi:tetratricopeptide (TPR) repeat protein